MTSKHSATAGGRTATVASSGKDGWRETTLDELASKIAMGPFGSDIKTDSFVPAGVPVIRGVNLTAGRFCVNDFVYLTEEKADELANANAHPGDIVITHRGTLGQVGLIPEGLHKRYVVSQSQMKLTCNPTVAVPGFIYYYLKSPEGQHALLMNTSQTGVPAISRPVTSLKRIRLSLPPLPEQRAIASILGSLDDKIEMNRRMNETLEGMARALFKSWFVDFDPVRAKAAVRRQHPRWTHAQVTRAACPTLNPEIAALFPDALQESELGEIPEGWRVGKVEDVANFNTWTLGRQDALDIIDYIEISEVMRGEVGHVTRYGRGEEPSRARRRLRHGDTVLSTVRPDRGAHFLALNPPETLVASTGFAVLTPKAGNWAFVHTAATAKTFGEELGRLADGGAYPAIRPEVIAGRSLVVPNDKKMIAAFDEVAQPLFLRAEDSRRQNRMLAAIRDALLPRLISGETRTC